MSCPIILCIITSLYLSLKCTIFTISFFTLSSYCQKWTVNRNILYEQSKTNCQKIRQTYQNLKLDHTDVKENFQNFFFDKYDHVEQLRIIHSCYTWNLKWAYSQKINPKTRDQICFYIFCAKMEVWGFFRKSSFVSPVIKIIQPLILRGNLGRELETKSRHI